MTTRNNFIWNVEFNMCVNARPYFFAVDRQNIFINSEAFLIGQNVNRAILL